MNPKSVDDLDPKLKEAYDRIMGTSVDRKIDPNASTPSENNQNTPNPSNPPTPQPTAQAPQPVMQTQTLEPKPAASDPNSGMVQVQSTPSPDKSASTQTPQPPASVFSQVNPVANPAPSAQKKKTSFLPVLAFIGGTIFFVVYGIIWAWVFGLF